LPAGGDPEFAEDFLQVVFDGGAVMNSRSAISWFA
jgi:hypothetical protein